MTTVPQPQFFSSLATIKNGYLATQRLHPKSFTLAFKFKNFRVLSSLGNSSSGSSPRDSSEKRLESSPTDADPVKIAFDKAKAYKKAIRSNPTPDVLENPVRVSDGIVSKNVELNAGPLKEEFKYKGSVELAFEKAKIVDEPIKKNDDPAPMIAENPVQELDTIKKKDGELKAEPLKAQDNDKGNNKEEMSITAQQAFEKAEDYRMKKNDGGDISEFVSGSAGTSGLNLGNVEDAFPRKESSHKKKELRVSSIDFVGLEFSEKKRSRGLPPGLVPPVDPFAGGDLPDVEILIGDTSKFADGTASSEPMPTQDEKSDIYKPRVSTWGVFPRPSNISKAYGGGRNIRPGQLLETKEDRAAKEARTRQLLATYKSKIGLNVDPKLKSECEKALKDGDSLMDLGKLKEALPFYQKVMDKLPFQNELYGLAALQWSICQDSLTRRNEARAIYEKLQSHPNPQVSKKARHLMFSFQAMEMMKVTSSTHSPIDMDYQNYFEAFVRNKSNYKLEENEEAEADKDSVSQALIYMIFLFSPILLVMLAAIGKRL